MSVKNTALSRFVPWRPAALEADWDALYAEQLPRVYNFLRYRVGPSEAEDLTARVYVNNSLFRDKEFGAL